jgi:hypothetical protein
MRRRLLAAACAGLAGLALLLPRVATARNGGPAAGWAHDGWDDWEDSWDDYNQTLIRMQRESISSQEEQAREAGRERRREEIEQSQEKSSLEHEAYFDAILEDSQAALKAPPGVYYRKPGYSAAEGPSGVAVTVEAGDRTYLYDQGIFWMQQGTRFIVVTAPVGAVVDRLPQGVTRVQTRPAPVWYFFGTFFGEKGGAFEVIKPAPGLTVFYLPDGYSQGQQKGAGLYRFGDILFKPVFIQGVLAYQVVEP